MKTEDQDLANRGDGLLIAVVQRVKEASVSVEGEPIGRCPRGLLVLLGVAEGDSKEDARRLAHKINGLRVFADEEGKMNLDAEHVGGEFLVVPQFTLLGDCRRGFRPGFGDAAKPERARQLYSHFVKRLREEAGEDRVDTGEFGAYMQVELVNDGPVTLIVESS